MCPPHAIVPIGSYSTDTWGRCSKCGAWVWSTDDDTGKLQYRNDWDLDAALAEAAFSRGDVRAAAKLLVDHDLPYGPVWETPSALLEMLRAITPSANDRARSEALDAAPPRGRWELAAKLLRETASSAAPDASELAFAMDLRFPGRDLGEGYEVGDAFVVLADGEMLRIDRTTGPSSVALPQRAAFLARTTDVLLFEAGRRIFRFDGALESIAIERDYVVRPADDGWWLCDPGGDLRGVELRAPNLQPRVKITMRGYPVARRMAGGWVLSQCVDDDGRDQALTLFDAELRSVAFSEGASGSRSIAVIDDASLWCETIDAPFVLERWARRGRELVRTFDLAVQSWCVVRGGGIVVSPRSTDGASITGYDDAGQRRFSLARNRVGATYFCKTKRGLLVYDDTSASVFDPITGETLVPPFRVDSPLVLAAHDGTIFMRTENVLFTIGEGAPVRLFVGESTRLETTCGDAAILRDDRGRCLLVGSDGQPRARFDAPNARFSVTGTRRGPYVVEPGRVRLV